eukprot:1158867-Pelagomonas_calceolata.AAC.8
MRLSSTRLQQQPPTWNTSMPAMKPARRDSDCRPLPPTPTFSRWPPSWRSTRTARAMCSTAYLRRVRRLTYIKGHLNTAYTIRAAEIKLRS